MKTNATSGRFTYVETPEPEITKQHFDFLTYDDPQISSLGHGALDLFVANQAPAIPESAFELEEESLPIIQPTPDAGINLSDEQIKHPEAIAQAIELQHYARQTPRFIEQAKDSSRTNILKYRPYIDSNPIAITEHEALNQLRQTLDRLLASSLPDEHRHEIEDIRNNLTFLGDKEVRKSTPGMAVLWRNFLEEDPKNVLCLTTLHKTNEGENTRLKSGPYIIGKILDNFTDEELAAYKGRIIDDPLKLPELGVDPNYTRIIAVDDSTISGSQLKDILREMDTPEMAPYLGLAKVKHEWEDEIYLKSVEINLLAAPGKLLEHGFQVYLDAAGQQTRVQVKAYYKNHEVEGHVRTTSAHSSMDWGFEETIRFAIAASDTYLPMPPLTFIERPYRSELPAVTIEEDGTLQRTQSVFTKEN